MEDEPPGQVPETQETDLTVAELIDIFRDRLDPEDDIPFMEGMDLDEAKDYILSALTLAGEEDPEGLMVERGVAERFYNFPEVHEIVNRPHTTEEADAMGRQMVQRLSDEGENPA